MDRRAFFKDSLLGLSGAFLTSTGGTARLIGDRPVHGQSYDVVVYESTPAGILAAVAAAREGARVALLVASNHLGGMVASGLGRSDTGRKACLGGLSLEFFQRVGRHYGQPTTWNFEPHVAENVFKQMAAEAGVNVFYRHRLKEHGGAKKSGTEITEIISEDGASFQGALFVDASYEGDLMAQAGCSYTVGREGMNEYNESLAGVRPKDWDHAFEVQVSAFNSDGKLLPEINAVPRGELGEGDKKVPAYNFRLCPSSDKSNQVPFPKPPSYTPERYAILAGLITALTKQLGRPPHMKELMRVDPLPNHKADINNNGAFSTDHIGASWSYPEATYEERNRIWQDHFDYVAGFLYYLSDDAQVPASLRDEVNRWGLAKDEFVDTNHWPWQLYVREARRMKGDFVLTEKDMIGEFRKEDVICLGSYNIDSHNVQRYVTEDDFTQNEGNMECPIEPFQVPYRVLVPKASEVTNLLVPVCVSASHVAICPLREEPYLMMLGHAAGVAAKMALKSGVSVQDINTRDLTKELRNQGAIMEWTTSQGHVG